MNDERPDPDRIKRLRATLLAGRGPGASRAEVREHTRDRPLLRAVPAMGEPARRQTTWPPPSGRSPRPSPVGAFAQQQCSPAAAAVIGALTMLVAQPVASRLARSVRHSGRRVRR
jgi:hypothetical protein